jgi:hypothetical protein
MLSGIVILSREAAKDLAATNERRDPSALRASG